MGWLADVGNALLGAGTDIVKTIVETRAQQESATQQQQQLYDSVANILRAKEESQQASSLGALLSPTNLLIGGAVLVFVILFTRRR